MVKASDKALEESMLRHRPARQVRDEVASTVFGQRAQEAQPSTEVRIDRILRSRYQQRNGFDEAHIEWLITSISEGGMNSPIVVRKLSDSDTRVVEAKKAAKVSESDTPGPSDSDTWFELVAGHNRTEAFTRMGRTTIPAYIRILSDAEAARALTSDNTLHRTLSDWELFKHIRMLRTNNFVKNVTDLAAVMGCSRATIYNLEAFGELPQRIHELLEETPALVGGTLAYELKPFSDSRPDLVIEALELVAESKIKQAGVIGFIQRKVTERSVPYRKEVTVRRDSKAVKMIMLEGEAKIVGDIDYDKLHALIEANLDKLQRDVVATDDAAAE